jgi:hypothetical protein
MRARGELASKSVVKGDPSGLGLGLGLWFGLRLRFGLGLGLQELSCPSSSSVSKRNGFGGKVNLRRRFWDNV